MSNIIVNADINVIIEKLMSNKYDELVFVCVGSDRAIFDSFGPYVGTYISRKKPLKNVYCYGTLDSPIHAINLHFAMFNIITKHSNACIVGIDACVGNRGELKKIKLGNYPLKPGTGSGKKNLPDVGEVCIAGTTIDENISSQWRNNFRIYDIIQMTEYTMKKIINPLFRTIKSNKLLNN